MCNEWHGVPNEYVEMGFLEQEAIAAADKARELEWEAKEGNVSWEAVYKAYEESYQARLRAAYAMEKLKDEDAPRIRAESYDELYIALKIRARYLA